MKALKVFARTHSLSFTRDYLEGASRSGHPLASVAWWNGDGRPVYYRPGTSDVSIVYDILFRPERKSEYWLPPELSPRVIFDIGGNIGAAARYLACRFPQAELHSFEPVPDNLRLMEHNLEGTRVQSHRYGLGGESGEFEFHTPAAAPEDVSGFSRFGSADASSRKVRAPIRAVPEALRELGLGSVDLIKIDIEGAEHDVIAAFPDDILAQTVWVYGELHGAVEDPRLAFALLQRLAPWFDIEVHKPLRKQTWFFDACNRKHSQRFRGFRRKS
ncbi:MAG TPA: FkbM family methyltransferase [Burkholderiales bacterium]|jgi:FkbM family methyltransferase|nr:FkbM family methyltransferase [Burkholderiales bacterium]